MISDKLKQIIFNELYTQLKDVEIIPYNGSIWFINRSEKYWYLELNSNNHLWWRYSFFVDFFQLFSLEIKEYEPLIREWTEWVLNHNVNTVEKFDFDNRTLLNKIIITSDYIFTDVINIRVNKLLEQTAEELKCEITESNHSEYNIDFISSYNAITSFEGTVKLIDNIESSSFAKSILTENIEVILNQPDV